MLQLVDHQRLGALFLAQRTCRRILGQSRDDLLVILRVQRVFRLGQREFFVEIGRRPQVLVLNVGVGQQLHHFVLIDGLAGFFVQLKQALQRGSAVFDATDSAV